MYANKIVCDIIKLLTGGNNMARGFSRSGRSSGGGGGGFSFGGGSRSGGGFSFGGGRSSSRSSRSYSSSSSGGYSGGGDYYHRPRRPRGPWHVPMFGRTVVISTGARSVFSIFVTILVMAVIVLFTFAGSIGPDTALINEQKEILKKCERYSKEYEKISTEALKDDDTDNYYLTTVDVSDYRTIYYYDDDPTEPGVYETDIWYNGEKQYFLVYEFGVDEDGDGSVDYTWNDSTFAEYSTYDIQDLKTRGLKIAYTFKGNELWAINAGYTLEDNIEYLYNTDVVEGNIASNNFNIIVTVVASLVIVAIVTGCVLYVVKQYKKAKKDEAVQDAKDAAEIAEAEAKAEEAQAKADRHNRFCMYCGAQIPAEDDVCPACGSRQFEKE